MLELKKIKIQLVSCAFAGGIVLSLTELANMLKAKETPDVYFLCGMLLAGVFGVIGFFISGATNFRTAFVSGVSAPQLLGGLVKLGTAGAQAVSCILMLTVYADTDSIDVKVVVNNVKQVEMFTEDSTYQIQDSIDIRIPYQDALRFVGKNFNENVELQEADATRITLKKTEEGFGSFLRGMFGQKQDLKHVKVLQE
ncbi:MAG: hypothetical protein PHF86_04315 [Candidatus Nanoarchaeia archaeon]|jgi:hypothetical protein|nr:hypothetical protein [Candidatus Nanoarchaeia archaeon]